MMQIARQCLVVSIVLFGVVKLGIAGEIEMPVVAKQGVKLGEIRVQADASGVRGTFNSLVGTPEPTLTSAAELLGASHFNWYQIAIFDNQPPVTMQGQRLRPPYIDPPWGGYGPSAPEK